MGSKLLLMVIVIFVHCNFCVHLCCDLLVYQSSCVLWHLHPSCLFHLWHFVDFYLEMGERVFLVSLDSSFNCSLEHKQKKGMQQFILFSSEILENEDFGYTFWLSPVLIFIRQDYLFSRFCQVFEWLCSFRGNGFDISFAEARFGLLEL